jgi:hypothetical protein
MDVRALNRDVLKGPRCARIACVMRRVAAKVKKKVAEAMK